MKGKLEQQLDEDIFSIRNRIAELDRKYKSEKEALALKISASCELQGNLFPVPPKIDKLFDDRANITVAEEVARKKLQQISDEILVLKLKLEKLEKRRPSVIKADEMQLSIT